MQGHVTNSEVDKNKMGGKQQEEVVLQPTRPEALVELGEGEQGVTSHDQVLALALRGPGRH